MSYGELFGEDPLCLLTLSALQVFSAQIPFPLK